jgi:hypothetical protein
VLHLAGWTSNWILLIARNTKENGSTIRCKGEVFTLGRTAGSTKVSTIWIRSMGTGSTNGMMVEVMNLMFKQLVYEGYWENGK